MKLQLHHLASYLPYGLMINQHREDLNTNSQSEMVALSADQIRVLSQRFPYSEDLAYYEAKPILHPLSDLTKPIKVEGYNDGKEFIPIVELAKIDANKDEDDYVFCDSHVPIEDEHGYYVSCVYSQYGDYTFAREFHICNIIDENEYWIIKLLYQWHFDIEGLIESGLAIDINTLNK